MQTFLNGEFVLRKGAMTKAWCGGMAIWLDHKGVGELRVSSGLLFGRLLNAGEGLECGRRSGGANTSVLVWEMKLLRGPITSGSIGAQFSTVLSQTDSWICPLVLSIV